MSAFGPASAGMHRLIIEIAVERDNLTGLLADPASTTNCGLRECWSRLRGLITAHMMAAGWTAPDDAAQAATEYAWAAFKIDLRQLYAQIGEAIPSE